MLCSVPTAFGSGEPSLFKLPYELRLEIYACVLVRDSENRIVVGEGQAYKQPPLTRVCRQLRNETLPVFHGQNCFEIKIPGHPGWYASSATWIMSVGRIQIARCAVESGPRIYEPWLRGIGSANRARLRKVAVSIEPCTGKCNYLTTMDFSRAGQLHVTFMFDCFGISEKEWRPFQPEQLHEHQGLVEPFARMLTSLGRNRIWQMDDMDGTPQVDFEALFLSFVEYIPHRMSLCEDVLRTCEVQCWLSSPWAIEPVVTVRNCGCCEFCTR